MSVYSRLCVGMCELWHGSLSPVWRCVYFSLVCIRSNTIADTYTCTHTQIWHQSMALNEVWKTGQRGLPVFYKQPKRYPDVPCLSVPTKSAHVSAKWQNIAPLKWYTLTEARTSVRTTSAAALWLWSGVKMSAPLPVFIVHFFAWVPSQWKWAISLYFYFCLALCARDQLFFL